MTNSYGQKQTVYVLNILYPLCNGLIKLSVLALFRRIFRPLSHSVTIIFLWTITTVLLWTIAFTIASIFACLTISNFFQPQLPPGASCLPNAFYDVLAATDLVTAIVVFALPVPASLNTCMSARKRIGTFLPFLLSVFVVVAGAVRLCYYLIQGTNALEGPDSSYYTPPLEYWSIIENSIGIWCACLPTLGPLFGFPSGTANSSSDEDGARHAPVGRPRDGLRAEMSALVRGSDNTSSDKTRETSYASGQSVVWPLPPTTSPTSLSSNTLLSPSKIWPRDALAAVKPVPPPKNNTGIVRLPSMLKSHPPIEERSEPPSEQASRSNSVAQAAAQVPLPSSQANSGRTSRSNSGAGAAPRYPVVEMGAEELSQMHEPSRLNSNAARSQQDSAVATGHHSRSNSGTRTDPQSPYSTAQASRSNSATREAELPPVEDLSVSPMSPRPSRSFSGSREVPHIQTQVEPTEPHPGRSDVEAKSPTNQQVMELHPALRNVPPSASSVPPRKSSMRKPVPTTPNAEDTATHPILHIPSNAEHTSHSSETIEFTPESSSRDKRAKRRTGIVELPRASRAEEPVVMIDGHEVSVMRDSKTAGLGTFYAHDESSNEDLGRGGQ